MPSRNECKAGLKQVTFQAETSARLVSNRWHAKQKPVQGWSQTGDMPSRNQCKAGLKQVTCQAETSARLVSNRWHAKQKPVQGWSQTGDMPCGSQCKAGKHTTRGSTPLQPALLLKKQRPLLHTHIPCSTHLASLKVRCRRRTLEPKVSASMSSVPVAYTRPAFTSAAHCASASHGACATVNHAPVTTAWNTQVQPCSSDNCLKYTGATMLQWQLLEIHRCNHAPVTTAWITQVQPCSSDNCLKYTGGTLLPLHTEPAQQSTMLSSNDNCYWY